LHIEGVPCVSPCLFVCGQHSAHIESLKQSVHR